MIIELHPRAPEITLNISKKLENIQNTEECAFLVKLSYYDNNTLFYLNRIDTINFDEYYIEIRQKNNSVCYLNYDLIQEYSIIPTEDIIDEGYI